MSEAHIYIYGIIDYFQDENAAQYGFVNLTSVKNQLEANKDADTIIAHIHSDGGDVDEGFAIYDFLKSQNKKVVTINEGNAHSIASVIFMAGSERRISPNASMLIHLPSGGVFGNSDQIEDYAERLKDIKTKIANLYKGYTTLTEEDILEHMKNEKEFTADEAVSFGFATEKIAQLRAVAKFTKRDEDMSKETLTKEELEKQTGPIMKALNKLLGIKDPNENPKNMIVQDANGTEIDFYEKTEGEPEVGDKANVDGSPASGEYTMSDGSVVTFESGEVTAITPAEGDDEIEDLKSEIEALKTENESLKASNKKIQDDHKKEIVKVKNQIEELKENLTTNFTIDTPPQNNGRSGDGNGGEPKKRNLFKTEK